MVAERYLKFEEERDETLDCVLTYKVKPSPVILRLLANGGS